MFKDMLAVGAVMCVGTLALFAASLPRGIAYAQSVAFTTLVMYQLVNVFNTRSISKSVREVGLASNKYLLAAVASSLALQLAVLYYAPLAGLFGTVGLGLADWVKVLAASLLVLVVMEFRKRGR